MKLLSITTRVFCARPQNPFVHAAPTRTCPCSGFGTPSAFLLSCISITAITAQFVLSVAAFSYQQPVANSSTIDVAIGAKKVSVKVDSQLFTEYDFSSYDKPILFPLNINSDVCITRHWPMQDGFPHEAHDHPHHKSVWFAHGNVDGIDFWSEKGTIRNRSVEPAPQDQSSWPGIVAVNQWCNGSQVVCDERSTIRFFATEDVRIVDFRGVLSAGHDLRFGDTKEGTFAIRTHPNLQLKPTDPAATATGHAVNSQGNKDLDLWGKPAEWVCYFGEIDGTNYGVAILDHPQNLRHPTTWHARDYGLVAANPFGLHDFQKSPPGTGDYLLPQGKELVLHYRIIIFQGPFNPHHLETWNAEFAKVPH